jgi:alpha-L-rhamnosidase
LRKADRFSGAVRFSWRIIDDRPEGRADQSNIDYYYFGDSKSEPFQTDMVTLSGEDDCFSPAYSYKGFRYVEVNATYP